MCELEDENNEGNVDYSDHFHWILEKSKNSSNKRNKGILCDILDNTRFVLDKTHTVVDEEVMIVQKISSSSCILWGQ